MNEEQKTLRDEFAMAALMGLCACPAVYEVLLDKHADSLPDQMAILAYDAADSMMQERMK